jgi:uncharacterized protein YndB with AHSA1/START domain
VSIRQHDFTIERYFRQAPGQTFQAFADPVLRQRWFRVPDGWTDTNWSLDFRVGGGEINAGRDHDGHLRVFHSRFHDIVEGERIVFAYDMLVDERLTSVSLATVELRQEDRGGTRLVFTEHAAFLEGPEVAGERELGMGLLLDRLEALLADLDQLARTDSPD